MPEPVASELSDRAAPDIVREWITKPPTWVDVRPVTSEAVSTVTDDLDLGERAAIALAETMHADLLLIDEAAGRAEAKRRNVPDLLERLKTTSFYLDEALLNAVFGRWLTP